MYRVVRGGSWFDQSGSLMFLTCSYRIWTRPGERSDTIGFRCAKSFPAIAPVHK
jgi:formylglycine-generating enzyme required for sulfatase activity